MKILFCTQASLSKQLGASKVTVELADELYKLGWECTIAGPDEVVSKSSTVRSASPPYREYLYQYLLEHASKYDIVEYDHSHLPYNRSNFPQQCMMVARSVLLAHHFENIQIPSAPGYKALFTALLFGKMIQRQLHYRTMMAHETINQADLVNVSNHYDKHELIKRGISENKIVVLPYGISSSRRLLFDRISVTPPKKPVIVFVGTFDYRKGAREFPQIVQNIVDTLPDVKFLLLGTAGLFQTKAEVLATFPKKLTQKIEVIPTFSPEQLPELLSSCSVGIFPSYIEGFGFGVLEMLAAAVPVIAYDAPGPPEMLPEKNLVPRGDTKGLCEKVIFLLKNPTELCDARLSSQLQSRNFEWRQIAKNTAEVYTAHLHEHRCRYARN